MAAASSNCQDEGLQHFRSAGRSPTFDHLKLRESVYDNIIGQVNGARAVDKLRKVGAIDRISEGKAVNSKSLEYSDTITPSTSNPNVLKLPALQQNRRLAVDLEFNDDAPPAWTLLRRVTHNVWMSLKMTRLFLSLAWADIKARTCSYCLGFFSVFIVVLLLVLMFSILVHMPILFLHFSEETRGEFDLIIGPGSLMSKATGINYTRINELFPESDPDYGYSAPRFLDIYMARTTRSCPGKNVTQMWYNADGSVCDDVDLCMSGCFSNGTAAVDLIAIDAAAEARMEFGTHYDEPTLNEGELILSHRAAVLMGGVNVGDTIILYGDARLNIQLPFANLTHNDSSNVMMPFKVVSVIHEYYRKFPDVDTFVVVSFQTFLRDLAKGLGPDTSTRGVEGVANTNPSDCASAVYFTMNPEARLKAYSLTSYEKIRRNVVVWASGVLSPLGFMQVSRSAPQLRGLYVTRLFSAFVGLIMSLILLALVLLSVVLIYTLLTVGIETKTYELGIQRMIGLTKENLIFLVLANAYAFTLPAWLIGLAAGQGTYTGVRIVFAKFVDVQLPMLVTGASLGWATVAGLGIPIVASFFPILSLVTQKLPDAINTSRGRNSGVIYKIERDDSTQWNGTMLVLGVLFFAFGFLIYYLFPTALIAMNLNLIFYIFFGVLIGLLAGLVLLAMNFERVAQTCISYLLLFWESRAVFSFMQKSLSAHRRRNRKTALMYALSLAFVIFITVVVQIQLVSYEYSSRQRMGCELYVETKGLTVEEYWAIEEIIEHQMETGIISAYTYDYNSSALTSLKGATVSSIGRLRSSGTKLKPLPPNYFEVMDRTYLHVNNYQSIVGRYGLVRALYSPEGLYKGILSSGAADTLGVGSADGVVLLKITKVQNATLNTEVIRRVTIRPVATLNTAPAIDTSKYTGTQGDVVLSIPGLFRHLNESRVSVLNGNVGKIRLRMNDPNWYDFIGDLLTGSIAALGHTVTVTNIRDATRDMAAASEALNFFFIVAEIMILVICFFSLMSSMTTNVLDSSKEIGVLLCLGMSHFQVYRVYVWEAFVLVVSSGVMGLIVGLVVAYTMQLQNILFTQLPLPFPFPYIQLAILVVIGLVSALASSISPVAYLLGLPSVTHILRRTIH
ncbi:conserved hypothetical protein [Leishmania major strain Friedlin]|uniref:ABC transmembrane type-1 domain-containing protein n=1 Tax=Leishmania major TaxID=5664 RepID=Q4Q2Z4_LEIMA|nr:conserved hypothetical protein [Leishmania major strain Friedlin]CAG9582077.1 FtsX-like_permease_family_-_putative [Leishmania major strain Friedlin]CAJ07919.1 conserved hypothetical protein [Leishmania major strain Friedlin]|eukprot:XP_001686304.1 conserved hypothetical protein [Leishmania major strain Friedlin]